MLTGQFAKDYNVDQKQVNSLLMATAFSSTGDIKITPEHLMTFLIVANEYKLNPFTKEIYAFPDKKSGKIVPVVGIDGWVKIMNNHPAFDGISFEFSDNIVQLDDHHKPCPEWCRAIIHRKDRTHPIIVTEYFDEVYKAPFKYKDGNVSMGPWQSHTKRFFRHKTLIQGARVAFGFSGIYDPDEAENIDKGRVLNGEFTTEMSTLDKLKAMQNKTSESQVVKKSLTTEQQQVDEKHTDDVYSEMDEAQLQKDMREMPDVNC